MTLRTFRAKENRVRIIYDPKLNDMLDEFKGINGFQAEIFLKKMFKSNFNPINPIEFHDISARFNSDVYLIRGGTKLFDLLGNVNPICFCCNTEESNIIRMLQMNIRIGPTMEENNLYQQSNVFPRIPPEYSGIKINIPEVIEELKSILSNEEGLNSEDVVDRALSHFLEVSKSIGEQCLSDYINIVEDNGLSSKVFQKEVKEIIAKLTGSKSKNLDYEYVIKNFKDMVKVSLVHNE